MLARAHDQKHNVNLGSSLGASTRLMMCQATGCFDIMVLLVVGERVLSYDVGQQVAAFQVARHIHIQESVSQYAVSIMKA